MVWNSAQNQYSERRARPENVAYLLKTVLMDSPKDMIPLCS